MKKKTIYAALVGGVSALIIGTIVVIPLMANADVTFNSFTPTEVATWTAAGVYPSGGVQSVTYAGRSNVMQMSINKDKQVATHPIEGVSKDYNNNTEYSIDLYLDPSWQNIATQAEFQARAVNNAGATTSLLGFQFSTAPGGSTGWEVLKSGTWSKVNVAYQFGTWVTLHIVINKNSIDYYIGNKEVGHLPLSNTKNLQTASMSAYNYGPTAASYNVSWHVGYGTPTDKSECRMWFLYSFKGYGQCVTFVNTGHDSR